MRYQRLTMCTKPASGELTKALSPLFQHNQEAQVVHDDVIISTETLEHHHKIISSIMTTIHQEAELTH